MTIPAPYQAVAQQAASAYGLPLEILDMVISHESSWDPNAVGDQGTSFGLAQIHLPAHPDVSREQADNPTYAIFWTAKELGAAYKQFNGDMAATIIYHNNPVGAEYYARTGKFGPTPGLSQASQAYLSAVLQPVGGIKGVNFAANAALSATGQKAIDLNPQDATTAPTDPTKPIDSTMEFAAAMRNLFGGSTSQATPGTTASMTGGTTDTSASGPSTANPVETGSGTATGAGAVPTGNVQTVQPKTPVDQMVNIGG